MIISLFCFSTIHLKYLSLQKLLKIICYKIFLIRYNTDMNILKIIAFTFLACMHASHKHCSNFDFLIYKINLTLANELTTTFFENKDQLQEFSKLIKLAQASKREIYLFLDIGEVIVYCTLPIYSRDITKRLYNLLPNNDINAYFAQLLNREEVIPEQVIKEIFTDKNRQRCSASFTDFCFSTAAFINDTALVNKRWKEFIDTINDSEIHLLLISTMHPIYEDARTGMLKQCNITTRTSEFSNIKKITPHYHQYENLFLVPDKSNISMILPNIVNTDTNNHIAIAVDDCSDKLDAMQKSIPSLKTFLYTEGQSITSLRKYNLYPEYKYDQRIHSKDDSEFWQIVKEFWSAIVHQALNNYYKHIQNNPYTQLNLKKYQPNENNQVAHFSSHL